VNSVDLQVNGVGAISAPLPIVLLLTLISFLPAILVTMTCFTRIAIVFHFLRLALFLTIILLAPVGARINELAVAPVMAGQITVNEGLERGAPPLRDFMLKQTRENDLKLFLELSKAPKPKSKEDLPMTVVIPAYAISELKTGFQMGFFLFVPFLLIDLVVSTTLLSMGMLQLPPAMISLPFKVLLFVMIDGWNLVVGSIVRSFA
jgi:flagellar biosynthetic protein FliP